MFQWERSFFTDQDFLSQAFTLHWRTWKGKTYESFQQNVDSYKFYLRNKESFL